MLASIFEGMSLPLGFSFVRVEFGYLHAAACARTPHKRKSRKGK